MESAMTDVAEQQQPQPLDRGNPLPLWAQLESDLRRRLSAGAFADRFPTDRDLVETYDVSRNTVREAVDRLCGEGLLERRRDGRGLGAHSPGRAGRYRAQTPRAAGGGGRVRHRAVRA